MRITLYFFDKKKTTWLEVLVGTEDESRNRCKELNKFVTDCPLLQNQSLNWNILFGLNQIQQQAVNKSGDGLFFFLLGTSLKPKALLIRDRWRLDKLKRGEHSKEFQRQWKNTTKDLTLSEKIHSRDFVVIAACRSVKNLKSFRSLSSELNDSLHILMEVSGAFERNVWF